MAEKSWQSIARSMQQHLANTIAAVEPVVPNVPSELPLNVTGLPKQLLTKEVVEITELAPEDLVSKLAAGSLTSVAVTKAFLQRAGLASRLVNCVTELLPGKALERARYLDDYYQQHGKVIGPLHSLPISVKEHVAMKGLDLNAGFISWVGHFAEQDGLILKLLWNAGAVFYARTTQPQTLMHLECSSNIYGVTVNPYNTALTSGGSSGGEGALLGLRGSCLGIGSDIGGSIRSPAANNGIFGLRPTSYRLPLHGLEATMLGEEQIIPVVGPLSTSLAGIKLFMQVLLDQKPWLYEPSLVTLPWRLPTPTHLRTTPSGARKLRIGLLPDDGVAKPHPPILRAFKALTSALATCPDIELIPFPPHAHAHAWHLLSRLYFPDGAAQERAAINASGEPWRPLSEWIVGQSPDKTALTLEEIWALTVERESYRAAYARHWNSVGTVLPGPSDEEGFEVTALAAQESMVDVILCPVGPGCAPPVDCARYWGYTAVWNLLDYPALVFPTGLSCAAEDVAEEGYVPRNERDAYNHELYSSDRYTDAPIALQLVGRRYEDEKVVEAMEMIHECVGWLPKAV